MVRTRFAPSPTGFLHVGGLRTCLYNYLYARKNNGTFILRIEDTDQKRYVEGAVESLLNTLKQVGLEYDEGPGKEGSFGPYIQSQRTNLYREHAQKLLDENKAYRCFCTAERLEQMREKQSAAKQAPMYDRACLNLSKEEIEKKLSAGEPYVIRQKIPHGRKLQFKDLVRGVVNFNTSVIDDQVLIKSDNFPTYHLANVVDDHLMEITHVIRGEEWLPSTPKHILLYEAFGWEPPQFAHIPLLLNKDKSKLSKRQGDVSVESYLEKNYIKEAIINFIALLGWHPGSGNEQEMFSLEDLVKEFSIEKVHKAGAIFDLEKLDWFNYRWKKKIFYEKLARLAHETDPKAEISYTQKGDPLFKFSLDENLKIFLEKRAQLLSEMCGKYLPAGFSAENPRDMKILLVMEDKIIKDPASFEKETAFFHKISDYDPGLFINEKMKVDGKTAKLALTESLAALKSMPEENFDDMEKIQEPLLKLVEKLGIKNGQLLWPMRVALSGEQFSPGVFELIWALGKEETLKRLNGGIDKLK